MQNNKPYIASSNKINTIAKAAGWKACLTDVLEADGMSASAGFIVGAAVAAASGPVAPLTFIGTIALESGVSSGWAYYRSSKC
jgi:hypothetical protein